MTNSEKLRALADWFDAQDNIVGRDPDDNEVQRDLRAMATEFEQFHKPVVMQAEGSDCAQGAAVASEGQGEANTCADCGRPKDEDGTCYSCEYGAMFGH